jgi:hypothetical protein
MPRTYYVRRSTATNRLVFAFLGLAQVLLSIPFVLISAIASGIAKGYKNDLRNRKSSTY